MYNSGMQLRKTLSTNLLHSLFVLFLLSLTVSCQKGDTGPAGTTGATGATGSANVIYSAWFTPSAYVKDTVFGTWGFTYTKAVAEITQPVLDSGVVLTFGKLDGYVTSIWPTSQVAQLPITILYMDGSTPVNDTWSALATLGQLKIQLQDDHNVYGSISNLHQFRYIIIPGGKRSVSAAITPGIQNGHSAEMNTAAYNAAVQDVVDNYAKMSYEEVCEKLNIPR